MPAEIAAVRADEGQLHQVLNILVLNAVHAMPDGDTVEVDCENVEVEPSSRGQLRPGPYVRISVRDQGVGIAPEHLSRSFDP